jgi:hypothetical protein
VLVVVPNNGSVTAVGPLHIVDPTGMRDWEKNRREMYRELLTPAWQATHLPLECDTRVRIPRDIPVEWDQLVALLRELVTELDDPAALAMLDACDAI